MIIGIYALFWPNIELVYIGQSNNIENRFKKHLSCMSRDTHSNYKVQEAYNLCGTPELVIIEKCDLSKLNNLEVFWTKEFSSLNTLHGLNIIEAGGVGYGPYSNAAKYSKLQILLVFKLLTRNAYIDTNYICEELSVSESLIHCISSGSTHIWLKTKFPNLYSKLKIRANKGYLKGSQANTISSRVEVLPVLIGPDNLEYEVNNIREFCRLHNLQHSNLSKVIRKLRHSHKGWRLKV